MSDELCHQCGHDHEIEDCYEDESCNFALWYEEGRFWFGCHRCNKTLLPELDKSK